MTRPADRTLTDATSGMKLPTVSAVIRALARQVRAWQHRRRTRAALTRLDAHMLNDIGLTGRQAEAETAKPFWQD